jgi:nitroreductase
MEALKNRKSTNAFQTQPQPREKLLELLWAAWGINRPDSGKRTAPTAMNAQEIDIYVLLPEGAYMYDAKGNQLTPVLAQDLRTKATTQESMKDAPVQLLFVADYAKFRANVPQAQKELYSACHTGFIGQNVFLYCAAEGLGAHFHTSIDRAGLKTSLNLRDDQAIVFAQVVGYPKE